MKRLIGVALLLSCMACESHRAGHRCIGIGEDPEPGVKYETSTQNVIVGILLVETIFVPAIVLLKDLRCPLAPDAAARSAPEKT